MAAAVLNIFDSPSYGDEVSSGCITSVPSIMDQTFKWMDLRDKGRRLNAAICKKKNLSPSWGRK
jgi:hypothetical protein